MTELAKGPTGRRRGRGARECILSAAQQLFRDQGISGVRRFLDRLWASVRDARTEGDVDADVIRKLHRTIKKVGEDCASLSYNTAIAAMMERAILVRFIWYS